MVSRCLWRPPYRGLEIAFAPVQLGNTLWRVRIPQVYGQCLYFFDRNLLNIGKNGDGSSLQAPSLIMSMENIAEINCLTLVDGLTQGMADRLTDEQIKEFSEWCHTAIVGLSWFVNLFWRTRYGDNNMFVTAFRDYSASTDSLLNGRYAQSRWDILQTVEKIIKGLRNIAGIGKPWNTIGRVMPSSCPWPCLPDNHGWWV